MSSKLPFNIDDLLRQRTVEGDRIEYKAGWNPDAIIKTLCAFANDFENLGGGYIVIGQDCDKDGLPIFPPVGLNDNQLDKIQRELLAYCNLIQPPYFPILSVEVFEGRNLIVLWAPGGQTRPYEVPRAVMAKSKVYHRGYDQREPIEVRVNPDRIQIVSFPGPDPSIRMESLRNRQFAASRYRNRRVGEFLKELEMTEGRSTGIPIIHDAMERNGSPAPHFETDEGRSYFLVELQVHPSYVPVKAPVEAPVTLSETERQILHVCLDHPLSKQEILQALGYQSLSGHVKKAMQRLTELDLLAYTVPDKPNSRNQKRKLTGNGRNIATQRDKAAKLRSEE